MHEVKNISATFMTEKEMEREAGKVKSWLERPERFGNSQLTNWAQEHKRINYTVTSLVSGYACDIESKLYGDVVTAFFDEIPETGVVQGSCVNITTQVDTINCDPTVPSIGLCKDKRPNQKLAALRFDGRSSCDDMSFAINMRYGEGIEELEELCRRNGSRRQLANRNSHGVRNRSDSIHTFGYSFTGAASRATYGRNG
jgi:hypothetical protein